MALLDKLKKSLESIKAGGVENPNKVDPALEAQLQARGITNASGKSIVSAEEVRKKAAVSPKIVQAKINTIEKGKTVTPVATTNKERMEIEQQKKAVTSTVKAGIPGLMTKKQEVDPELKAQLEKRGMTEKLAELEKPVPTLYSRVVSELAPTRAEIRQRYVDSGDDFYTANKKANDELTAMGNIALDDNTVMGLEIGSMKQVGNKATRALKELFQRGLKEPGSYERILKEAETKAVDLGQQGLQKLKNIFQEDTPTVKEKAQQLFQGAKELPTKIRTALVSRFTPVGEFEKDIVKASGVAKPQNQLPLQSRFELFSGAAGKAESKIRVFEDEVIKPVKDNLEDFNNYLALQRIKSRLGTGLERAKVADWTPEMVMSTEKALSKKVGEQTMNKFKVQAVKYNDMLDASLRELVDSGRLSKEGYDAIKANNDFYAKFKVMKYVNDLEKDVIKGTGGNVSLGKEEVIKAMTGITDKDFKLGNLLNTAEEVIYQNKIIGEKNLIMKEFAKVAEQGADNGFVKDVTGKTILEAGLDPKTWDKVTYYDGGVLKELAVNKDVANSIKGMVPSQMGIFSKVMQTAASPFRWGVTTANAGFQIVNALFADIPRNLIQFKYGNSAKELVKFPLDVVYSYFTSFKGNFGKMNDLFKQFLDSGAANSTIARDIRPEAFQSRVLKGKSYNPFGYVLDGVNKFANAVEEGGKILGIKRGLPAVKEGKITMEQLADEVRKYSGSPDFLRRGTATRPLNLLYMFLNARIQGVTLDLKRLGGLTGGKEAAQAWAKLLPTVGIPALTLAIVNKEKYAQDYAKLNQTEKDNYFIIFRNDFATNDKGELYRKYWKIPKRETVKLFSNLVEAGVNFAYSHDFESAKVAGQKFLNDISPVNISGSSLSERGESIISGTNPLIKTPYEYVANRNAYFHSDQVPQYMYGIQTKDLPADQQYYINTPKFYQWMGDQLDESPIKLQNLFASFTGNLLKENPIKNVINRFQGTGRLDLTDEEKTTAKKVLDDLYAQNTDKIESNRKAQELYAQIGDLKVDEQKMRLAELKRTGWLTPEIFDRYTKLYEKTQLDYNETDYNLKALGVTNGRRAASMYSMIKDMPNDQQKLILREWKAKNLLSEAVLDQLNWMGEHPKTSEKILTDFASNPEIPEVPGLMDPTSIPVEKSAEQPVTETVPGI